MTATTANVLRFLRNSCDIATAATAHTYKVRSKRSRGQEKREIRGKTDYESFGIFPDERLAKYR